ncbi:MAG: cytochrome c maturation protein CcmE [Actinomycetota bacterium]|nr:cytochrome c maturation protein CcmE [Actinomycetota bacterium]MED5393516.1 cytochrome c maturation protein CcmE [Actinomycetota bacterium]
MPDPGDGVDLTPTPTRPVDGSGSGTGRRRLGPILLVVVLVVALAAVLFRTLGDTALFFYEVDRAVELRPELDEARFRVVGTPQPGLLEVEVDGEAAVVFTLCAADILADVVHVGDPAELFQPGVPVVLQGSWVRGPVPVGLVDPADDGWHLRTDHMVVKHDNDYRGDGADLTPCGVRSSERSPEETTEGAATAVSG